MTPLSDWWTALPIMGWRFTTIDGHACLERPKPPAVLMRIGDGYILHGASEWDLFGEAVEWIEERLSPGELYSFIKHSYTGHLMWTLTVWPKGRCNGLQADAPTLPAAAARWVVEHGHLLRDVRKMVKEGSDG